MNEIISDTGPLVAYLDRSDRDHAWAKEVFMGITRPLLTCEAVIADACLVRMSEIYGDSKVMTLDSDFTVYRKSRRRVIPLICPSR